MPPSFFKRFWNRPLRNLWEEQERKNVRKQSNSLEDVFNSPKLSLFVPLLIRCKRIKKTLSSEFLHFLEKTNPSLVPFRRILALFHLCFSVLIPFLALGLCAFASLAFLHSRILSLFFRMVLLLVWTRI